MSGIKLPQLARLMIDTDILVDALDVVEQMVVQYSIVQYRTSIDEIASAAALAAVTQDDEDDLQEQDEMGICLGMNVTMYGTNSQNITQARMAAVQAAAQLMVNESNSGQQSGQVSVSGMGSLFGQGLKLQSGEALLSVLRVLSGKIENIFAKSVNDFLSNAWQMEWAPSKLPDLKP
ncbi:MAG: hypothetical protein EZS28_038325, partial [Streblomastix strix]